MEMPLIAPMSLVNFSKLLQISLCLSAFVIIFLAFTYISTTIQFQRATSKVKSNPKPNAPIAPPTIPYTLPWLGLSLAFLDEERGRFWENLREKLGQHHEACTVVLGGMTTYILNARVENLFKASKVIGRERFDRDIIVNGFGMSVADCAKFQMHVHQMVEVGSARLRLNVQDALYHEYLLAPPAANALTAKFVETLRERVEGLGKGGEWVSVDLCRWLRDDMFVASTTAFMGSKVLEMCPTFAEDYWVFDSNILKLVYNIPKFFAPEGHRALKRLLDAGEEWHREAAENVDLDAVEDLDWEPWYGSKFLRARQQMYARAGLSIRGTVSPDIGFLFGLSSNAIPASTWILLHLLTSSDETLVPAVVAEIQTAVLPNNTISISTLTSLPLLQSIYQEVLRLYVDVFVTREVYTTFVLPPNHLMKKGNAVIAPSYLFHHDSSFWPSYNTCSSPSTFDPYRFLHPPSDSEKSTAPSFSTAGTTGKYFPYGGGAHMCPGRVFAKQEILAAVAIVLLEFEIQVEDEGRGMPGVKRAYSGTGVVAVDGGFNVRLRKRNRK